MATRWGAGAREPERKTSREGAAGEGGAGGRAAQGGGVKYGDCRACLREGGRGEGEGVDGGGEGERWGGGGGGVGDEGGRVGERGGVGVRVGCDGGGFWVFVFVALLCCGGGGVGWRGREVRGREGRSWV